MVFTIPTSCIDREVISNASEIGSMMGEERWVGLRGDENSAEGLYQVVYDRFQIKKTALCEVVQGVPV